MRKILLIAITLILANFKLYACGGGLMAYTPSSGNIGSGDKKADYFIIEKGVSSTMFDVKALQPVFRDIKEGGNERNMKNLTEKKKLKSLEKMKTDKSDSTTVACDSEHHHKYENEKNSIPVLNLDKIH